jgi:hypothetical protein
VTREEAIAAANELAASPAAGWVGIQIKAGGGALIHKCARCGAEELLELPVPASALANNPALVPAGFDDKIFAWSRSFHKKHAICVEAKK